LKSTGEFITFCEPTGEELEDLFEMGNFGGKDDWFSSKAKNMPPEKPFVNDFTPIYSFETDVLGLLPADSD
jgi:hypothetical protein